MKILADILEKMRPLFEEGGKLSRLHPIYGAAEHVFFSATEKTKHPPFGRDPLDIKRYMFMVILALLPCFAASLYFFGGRILVMILVSYVVGGTVEVLFSIVRKEDVAEGFLVTGFIFPLVLPPGVPLWMVGAGIAFGVIVGKEIFGGTGRNLFNPAILGRCFLAFSYPKAMSGTWMNPGSGIFGNLFSRISFGVPDAVSSATPLAAAKAGELASTMDLFLGRVAGSAGETSAVAVLLGGIFLLAVGVANWRTVVSTLVSFVALGAVLKVGYPSVVYPPLFNLLSGGILFGAFFMATDPVTSPITQGGKWAYGILIGSVTMMIRSFSGYIEGVTFAILLGNICAPLMDEVVIRFRMRRYARER